MSHFIKRALCWNCSHSSSKLKLFVGTTKYLHTYCRYKNRNILSLVAISNDGPRPCLIYEYMENGSLADCLQGKVCILRLNSFVLPCNCIWHDNYLFFHSFIYIFMISEKCLFVVA